MKKIKEILRAICAACSVVKVLTSNEEAWGHTFVAVLCAICGIAGTVAAVDSINKAYIAGKKAAKSANIVANVTEKTFSISKGFFF